MMSEPMTDYRNLEAQLNSALCLKRRPVAVAFRDRAPAGVRKFTGTEPSGCSFWRLAGEGKMFYTEPRAHYNCAIGCFTHNIPLPAERAGEMEQTLGFMMNLGYVKPEDLERITRLRQTPQCVIYAPLGETPVEPDVVLFAGQPGRLMLLQEAAIRADVGTESSLGRPTCMALPAALDRGLVASSGCIGNRVYTELGEDELYVAVRGSDLPQIARELETIVTANARLAEYHQARRKELATE